MRTKAILLLIATGIASSPALAYIDPGSGSAIMSAVIGFFVAIAMAVKTYWYKIKSFFTGGSSSSTAGDTPEAVAGEAKDTESNNEDARENAG